MLLKRSQPGTCPRCSPAFVLPRWPRDLGGNNIGQDWLGLRWLCHRGTFFGGLDGRGRLQGGAPAAQRPCPGQLGLPGVCNVTYATTMYHRFLNLPLHLLANYVLNFDPVHR